MHRGFFLLLIAAVFVLSSCSPKAEYTGETKNGLPHGWGSIVYPNGTTYVGEFNEGLREGEGTWKHQNGTTYSGTWKNDLYHGRGILIIPGRLTYEGEWVEGSREGYGIQKWENSERYEGYWKNDRMHGEGTIFYADGSAYKGLWNEGQMVGEDGTASSINEADHNNESVSVEQITLNLTSLTFNLDDDSVILEAVIVPENAANQQIDWTSSNTAVAVVDNGVVTPVSSGSAVVSASAGDVSAECQVTVKESPAAPQAQAAVTHFHFNRDSLLLRMGGKPEQLDVIIKPDWARNTAVLWRSSDPNIAVVSSTGWVTPRMVGKTTITAQIPGTRFRDVATVTVLEPLD